MRKVQPPPVDRLTLEQQVGQLIVLSFTGTTPPAYVRELLRGRRVAGVILFGRNISSPAQVRALTAALRKSGGSPVVAVDQEGGAVRRLPWAPPVASAGGAARAWDGALRCRGGRTGIALDRDHA